MISLTVSELLRQARLANGSLGDGVTPTADEIVDDMLALNLLLASWDAAIYANVQETKTLTTGVASYTWGTGGDINSERPIDLLDQTYIRSGDIDYTVELITQPEYNAIPDKSTSSRPDKIFFDPKMALAYVYFYPVPDSAYVVYLTSLKAVTELTGSTDTITLPQETLAALKWNLAVEIAPNYNVPVSPVMQMRAVSTKAIVINRAFKYRMKQANFDNVVNQRAVSQSGTILGW